MFCWKCILGSPRTQEERRRRLFFLKQPLLPSSALHQPPRPAERTQPTTRAAAAGSRRGAASGSPEQADGRAGRRRAPEAAPGTALPRRSAPQLRPAPSGQTLRPPPDSSSQERLGSAAGTGTKGDGGNEELRRALRLSQSRAREAEQKLAATNGGLAALLVRDSVLLSAHRRWVMMLEAENSALRAAGADTEEEDEGDGPRRPLAAAWWVALAVCVVGLALASLLL
ncbi:hypothetical protein ACQJBY_072054 [Aegilops geniculata]